MSGVRVREFRFPADYRQAIDLWSSAAPAVRVGMSDSEPEILKKLARDPDLFLIAEAEGRLVGTVIGGFDGRRGLIYHLAVARAFRRQGVASLLMQEVEERLRRKGCLRCYLLVRPDNVDAQRYYEAVGWKVLDDLVFGKDLA
jgi:ribosomal protein S18 acetylase RimI-like enzyme